MYFANMYGGNCEPDDTPLSKSDKKALLEERKAILEAKLATISHWIESLDKAESKVESRTDKNS